MICLALLISGCGELESNKIAVANGPVSIAYEMAGTGDTAIILVHGWSINKSYWKDQITPLSKRFKVIAMDLGGHGQSGHNRKDWTIENYSADLIALINQLNLRKVILVGHSMSGEICLATALAEPEGVIGLIGIDNFKGFVQRYTPEEEAQSKEFLQALGLHYDSLVRVFVRSGLFPPDSKDTVSINRVIHDATNEDSKISLASLESLMKFSLQDSAMLGKLRYPLHLIACDPPPNDSALKAICKSGYEVRMIHGTGHYPMIEKPAEFSRILEETIDDISKGK